MSAKFVTKYTLVRHSGYYTGHGEFSRAVETAAISTPGMERKVRDAGGLIFDDYVKASDAEEDWNGVTDNRPFLAVPGSFSPNIELGHRQLWIPPVRFHTIYVVVSADGANDVLDGLRHNEHVRFASRVEGVTNAARDAGADPSQWVD